MSADGDKEIAAALANNARAVFSLAPLHCRDEHNCLLYHRLWPLARIARGAPFRLAGSDFLIERISQSIHSSDSRILIAGAADTGLLELVLQGISACKLPGAASTCIVLADRCKTVIEQNRAYASQAGIELECHQCNLLELDCPPVNAIIAHSVFTFFPPQERHLLFAQWRKLLLENGEVLLSSLMHRSKPEQAFVPASALSKEAFLSAAQQIGFTPQEQAELSTILVGGWQFAGLLHRAPVLADFQALCLASGFDIAHMHGMPFVEEERGPAIKGDYQQSQRVEARLVKLAS